MMSVNYWAVLVSAIVSMVIGSIWYGPLFGKLFMREMGMDKWSKEKQNEMKKGMALSYLGQFVASLVMFYFVAVLMIGIGNMTLRASLLMGALVWVGFVVPIKLGDAIWGGKKVLFLLGIGNMLITLLAACAIIGTWR